MSKKIKLLVVDDEARFLKTLSDRLSLRDFDVTAASSGEQAMDEAGRQVFDVALVDLKMPGIGGDKLLEMLKEKHPFIFCRVKTFLSLHEMKLRFAGWPCFHSAVGHRVKLFRR